MKAPKREEELTLNFFPARWAFHCISLTVLKVNAPGIPQWLDTGVSNDWCITLLCSVPCPCTYLDINMTPIVGNQNKTKKISPKYLNLIQG